jgi:hypothetical protein
MGYFHWRSSLRLSADLEGGLTVVYRSALTLSFRECSMAANPNVITGTESIDVLTGTVGDDLI